MEFPWDVQTLDKTVHAVVRIYPVTCFMLLSMSSAPCSTLFCMRTKPGDRPRSSTSLPQRADAATTREVKGAANLFSSYKGPGTAWLWVPGTMENRKDIAKGGAYWDLWGFRCSVLTSCIWGTLWDVILGLYVYYLWDYIIMQLIHGGY